MCFSTVPLGKDRVISRKLDLNGILTWLFPSMGGILETSFVEKVIWGSPPGQKASSEHSSPALAPRHPFFQVRAWSTGGGSVPVSAGARRSSTVRGRYADYVPPEVSGRELNTSLAERATTLLIYKSNGFVNGHHPPAAVVQLPRPRRGAEHPTGHACPP